MCNNHIGEDIRNNSIPDDVTFSIFKMLSKGYHAVFYFNAVFWNEIFQSAKGAAVPEYTAKNLKHNTA